MILLEQVLEKVVELVFLVLWLLLVVAPVFSICLYPELELVSLQHLHD